MRGEPGARDAHVVGVGVGVEHHGFLLDRAVRHDDDREQQPRLEQREVHAAHVDRLGLRADHDRGVRGDPGEQLAGLVEEIVHRHGRAGEEVGDAPALGGGQRARAGEMVDVVAVAGVGRAPGRPRCGAAR